MSWISEVQELRRRRQLAEEHRLLTSTVLDESALLST